jgi:hypothetical protein
MPTQHQSSKLWKRSCLGSMILLALSPRTATGQAKAPAVEFQAVPGREEIVPGESLTIVLFVSNNSTVTLDNLELVGPDNGFSVKGKASLPQSLPPFSGARMSVLVETPKLAQFGRNHLLLALRYRWKLNGTEIRSMRPTAVNLVMRRSLEEQAKGLPFGTAALVYLLLPIFPAALSYQLFDRLRTTGRLEIPSFPAAYLVPGFLIGLVVSYLVGPKAAIESASLPVLLRVVATSFAVGAAVPVFLWVTSYIRRRRWGFAPSETLQSYLRKALLSPSSPDDFVWAKGTASGEAWEGIQLYQPGGETVTVLGPTLQATPSSVDEETRQVLWNRLILALAEDGTLLDRKRLMHMVEDGEVSLNFLARVRRGSNSYGGTVAVKAVAGFQREEGEVKAFIRPIP